MDYFTSLLNDIHILSRNGVRFARLSSTGFAVVPPGATEGDFITLLVGNGEFRVIRKEGDHYILVGHCGMEIELGSMQDKLKSGEVKAVTIELR